MKLLKVEKYVSLQKHCFKMFNIIIRIFLSLLPIIIIGFTSFLLYSYFQSTLILIIVLLLMFFSVMGGVIIWGRLGKKSTGGNESTELFSAPELEHALIYVLPQDFVEKLEKFTGHLYVVGTLDENNYLLVNAQYDKLRDITSLTFNKGVKIEVTGLKTIGVGDVQFSIFGFDNLTIKKGEVINYNWSSSDLVINRKNEKRRIIPIKDGNPVLVFTWGDVAEINNW